MRARDKSSLIITLLCYSNFDKSSLICLSFLHSTQDGFMKSFQTQRTMWATDWPVTRRTTQSPTPLPSSLLSHSCPSTPTTPHKQPLQPAAAAPTRQKTPSLLLHTPRPSLNTPRCRDFPLLPPEWRRTLFPKSSTSEPTLCHKLKPLERAQMTRYKLEPFLTGGWKNVVNLGLSGRVSALKVTGQCSFCCGTWNQVQFWNIFSLLSGLLLFHQFFEKGRLLKQMFRTEEGQVKDLTVSGNIYIAWMYYIWLGNTPN